MAHHETDWRPEGAGEQYRGFDVWDHGVFPNEINHGQCDGEVSLSEDDADEE